MSAIENLDLNQLEKASGGVYNGQLSQTEINIVVTLMKSVKQNGSTLEDLLNRINDTKGNSEFIKACKEFVRAYWDHV